MEVTEYEQLRMKRIKENNMRMEALGISLPPKHSIQMKKKQIMSKKKTTRGEKDEEYCPQGDDGSEDDAEDEEFESEKFSKVLSLSALQMLFLFT